MSCFSTRGMALTSRRSSWRLLGLLAFPFPSITALGAAERIEKDAIATNASVVYGGYLWGHEPCTVLLSAAMHGSCRHARAAWARDASLCAADGG